ncbi:MAG: hypothetical protein WAW11_01830 [Patescibacteria group bacterium]
MELKELNDDELISLLDDGKTSQEEVLTNLLNRDLAKDNLLYLIESWPRVRRWAWTKYLNKGASKFELRYIMKNVSSLSVEATVILCSRNLDEADLRDIVQYSENNVIEAQERLRDLLDKKPKIKVEVLETSN